MATLYDFLATGQLGEISAGMARDKIREILGEPADRSKQKNPEIWKYGGLQVAFRRDKGDVQARVAFIGLYFRNKNAGIPPELGLSGWIPSGATTLEDFKNYLSSADQFPDTSVAREEANRLVTKANVSIEFQDGKLDSIQYTGPEKAKAKQLAVQLPEKVAEIVRKVAAEHGVSMSAICAQWISEHVAGSSPPAPA